MREPGPEPFRSPPKQDTVERNRAAEVARLRDLRRKIHDGLSAMLEVLDAMDGDGDLEDEEAGPEDQGDAEPTLGATAALDQTEAWRATFSPHEDGEAEEDDPGEPSLGSLDQRSDQTNWASGKRDDREQDAGDEGEPDVDGEHSLGSTLETNQVLAWASFGEEEAVADSGGVQEVEAEAAAVARFSWERLAEAKAAGKETLAQLRAKIPGRMRFPDEVVILEPGVAFCRGRRL